jgi:hypothetical protein
MTSRVQRLRHTRLRHTRLRHTRLRHTRLRHHVCVNIPRSDNPAVDKASAIRVRSERGDRSSSRQRKHHLIPASCLVRWEVAGKLRVTQTGSKHSYLLASEQAAQQTGASRAEFWRTFAAFRVMQSSYDAMISMNPRNDDQKESKRFRKASRSCTIAIMRYLDARSCRSVRHLEALKGLLTPRGRTMTESLKAQSFNWVQIDPEEVPSTA